VEERYDTEEDPHEVRNLADLPEFESTLETMRSVHSEWVDQTGDLGMIPELDLVRRMWPPDGVQPETEAPVFSYKSDSFEESLEVELESATRGASIAYRTGDGERWLLYSKPITIEQTSKLTAQAIRIGFKPSQEVSVVLTRTAAGR
jgi:hypothetical protein